MLLRLTVAMEVFFFTVAMEVFIAMFGNIMSIIVTEFEKVDLFIIKARGQ
jgi:hypothetical protein